MDRVENQEVKEYIVGFAADKLEACDLFVEVFGKGSAKKRLDINLDKVYTNEVDEDIGGYYNTLDSSVTICDKKPRERKLSVRDIKNIIYLQEVSLHELVHAILRRTKGECKRYKIKQGTGMKETYQDGSELGRGLNEGLTNWICKKAGINTSTYIKLTSFIEILEGEIGEKNVMKLGKGNIQKRAYRLLHMSKKDTMSVIRLADTVYNLEDRNRRLRKWLRAYEKGKEHDEQTKREYEEEIKENTALIDTTTVSLIGKIYDRYLLEDVENELSEGKISLGLMKRLDNFEELVQKCKIDGTAIDWLEQKYSEVSEKFKDQIKLQANTYFQNGELTIQKIEELERLASRERSFTSPEILEYIAGIINPNEKEEVTGLLCNLAVEGRLEEAGDFRIIRLQGEEERVDAYILQGETIATSETGFYGEEERSGIEDVALEFTLGLEEDYIKMVEAFEEFTDSVLAQNGQTKFEIFGRLIVNRDEQGERYFILENNQVIPAKQITKEPIRPNIAEERNNLPAIQEQSMLERFIRDIRKRLYRNDNEQGIHIADEEVRNSVSQSKQSLKEE